MDTLDEANNERAHQLATRSSSQLAAFVLKLAREVDGVDERIEAFLVSDSSGKAADLARSQLTAFRRSRRSYDYRRARELADRLEQILDLIDTAVLPSDPSAAFHLIVEFIECDGHALECVDDSDGMMGGLFLRACGLFGRAAKALPSKDVLPVLRHLLSANGYGTRDYLLHGIGEFLDRPHLEAFIGQTRGVLAGGGEASAQARAYLKAIADSIRDPVLFEEAIGLGRDQPLAPRLMLESARRFLEAGRARDARDKLPASSQGLGAFTGEFLELRVRVLQALGDAEALRPALWSWFAFSPSRETLRELLAAEPAETRSSRRAAAFEHVRGRLRPQEQAEFFASVGELRTAASIVVSAPGSLNGDHYDGLVPLAERLEIEHPLAAVLVYRALLDSILRRGAPKSYHHGARYWRILHELSGPIDDWTGLEPPLAYRERIDKEHARKSAFWKAVKLELGAAQAE